MKIEHFVQNHNDTVKYLLEQKFANSNCENISVASAYCTVSGLREFQKIFTNAKSFEFLTSLDDYITSPDVLKLMQIFNNSKVRIAGTNYTGKKFHPKVYFLNSIFKNKPNTLIVGSANLTISGLTGNIEALTIVESESLKEKLQLTQLWQTIWRIGLDVNDKIISDYVVLYKKNKPSDKRGPKVGQEILKSDEAIIDPEFATTCWIEVGKITGFNREQLEIKAEQALFFGLNLNSGRDQNIKVTLNDNQNICIPAKYRDNAMWRFNLPSSIPEVAAGLRPDHGRDRSPFVAVFTKINGMIRLKFIKNDSRKFQKIKKHSNENGTISKTSARYYGWF